jgi:hypothetical protein
MIKITAVWQQPFAEHRCLTRWLTSGIHRIAVASFLRACACRSRIDAVAFPNVFDVLVRVSPTCLANHPNGEEEYCERRGDAKTYVCFS